MNRFLIAALLFAVPVQAADLTAGVSTPNDQKYSQGYRDIKDGTNAPTRDFVSANSITQTSSAQNTIKASAGYVEHFVINAGCTTGNYVLADAAAAASAYAVVVSTIAAASTQAPAFVPVRARFNNGISFNVPYSTCPVTISYR